MSLVYEKPALARDTKKFFLSISKSGNVTLLPAGMCGCTTFAEVPLSLQLTSTREENIVGYGNALCARSGFLMFLREPQ